MKKGRNCLLKNAIQLIQLINSYRYIDTNKIMQTLNVKRRTAQRWVHAAEEVGLIRVETDAQDFSRLNSSGTKFYISKIRI